MIKKIFRVLHIILVSLTITSCGGGSTSSGTDIDVPMVDIPDNLTRPRTGSEFIAEQCINASVGIGGTQISNSCNDDVNVRRLLSGSFGPVFLIRANSTTTINGAQIPLAACVAPFIPGGVADLLQYQCLN